MKAYVHLYLTEFFLEWEKFKIKVVERMKTHILSSITFFFPEHRGGYDVREKEKLYDRTVHRWQHSTAQKRCDFHAR